MKRNEVLTLDNFWNDMKAQYPLAMKEYCDWIDQLKIDVDWPMLFAGTIKNHNLPAFFQLGVFLQFLSEQTVASTFSVNENWKTQIEVWFIGRETQLMINPN